MNDIYDQPHVESAREFYKRFSSLERQLRKKTEAAESFRQLYRDFPDKFSSEIAFDRIIDLQAGADIAAALFCWFILSNLDHIRFS